MGLKNLIQLDADRLKHMKVEKKFSYTFKRIYLYLGFVVALMLITLIAVFYGFNQMYGNYYQQNTYQGLLRIHNQNFAKSAWWANATKDASDRSEQIKEFDETMINNLHEDLNNLIEYRGETELTKSLQSDVSKLDTLGDQMADLYNKGTPREDGSLDVDDEVYAIMRDQVRPIVKQTIEDSSTMAEHVQDEVNSMYGTIVTIIIVLFIVALAFLILLIIFMKNAQKKLTQGVLDPVKEVMIAAEHMAQGDLNIKIDYEADDELGTLARDLENSTQVSMNIVDDISTSLNGIAGGDFTVGTANPSLYLGNFKPISNSMDEITNRLSETLSSVKEATARVSEGAENMSRGSTDLAEGATDQAAAVEELTASVATVTEQTENVAQMAEKGVSMSVNAQEESKKGAEMMDRVISAMDRITNASKEIEEVANAIESIASQTQLLALNASIEAARAGESGRGFAVVAEEIGILAKQSNDAVQRTHQLVDTALQEIENGNRVVQDTQTTLLGVGEAVNQLADMMRESGSMARDQAQNMREINDGIEQISNVIQNNSATAQESSAVSTELSDQSISLNELVSQFQVK
ncbi:MAG: HAMP domain-containing protein [Lachnospiraceae bacterium]|nr:HAMP domain-containing protein [Lachnospiraceae bacterium]